MISMNFPVVPSAAPASCSKDARIALLADVRSKVRQHRRQRAASTHDLPVLPKRKPPV
jgi:hypothetical protein